MKNTVTLRIVFASILVSFALFINCKEDNPVVHEQLSVTQTVKSDIGTITLLKIDKTKLITLNKGSLDSSEFYIEKYLKAKDDGDLEINNELVGKSKIKIEKNSLPYDMTVAFKWCETNIFSGKLFSTDLPDADLALNYPAEVILSYGWADLIDVNEEDLGFFYFNNESQKWEEIACVIDQDKKLIITSLNKFGEFRLLYKVDDGLLEFHQRDPEVFYAKKHIKADKGGDLKVGTKKTGVSKITFEKGDLPEDLTIEFEWAADGTIDGNFAPHGTVFNNPVLVEFSYQLASTKGFDEGKLAVFYHNQESGLWEYVGGYVYTKDKIVSVYLEHFSRYAVAYGN